MDYKLKYSKIFPFFNRFTERKIQLIELVAQCYTDREIGRILCISEKTVKFHMYKVYKALKQEDSKYNFKILNLRVFLSSAYSEYKLFNFIESLSEKEKTLDFEASKIKFSESVDKIIDFEKGKQKETELKAKKEEEEKKEKYYPESEYFGPNYLPHRK